MARRKSALHMRSKSLTVEGASTEHVDEETNQEMHKASMQDIYFTKNGKAWRDHKCRLKMAHYIPHLRNKAQVKSNQPKGCIPEDWDVLVDYWYIEDAEVDRL
uniref:Uncharacterized protein n=1 Tax=Quercus lobata TaxID=97700 RepID=A0A7N2MVL4_QUELO